MEVAAGKVKSKPVTLENGMTDVVQWTLASAAANKLNVLRMFAHGVEGSFALQIKAGQSWRGGQPAVVQTNTHHSASLLL